jgi:prevent-host-death family protein
MSEARASFAEVLTRAEQGEAVQVTRAGKVVAVVSSVEHFRMAERGAVSASEAFRKFMKTRDPQTLTGSDPWKGVRERSPGRDFRW